MLKKCTAIRTVSALVLKMKILVLLRVFFDCCLLLKKIRLSFYFYTGGQGNITDYYVFFIRIIILKDQAKY